MIIRDIVLIILGFFFSGIFFLLWGSYNGYKRGGKK